MAEPGDPRSDQPAIDVLVVGGPVRHAPQHTRTGAEHAQSLLHITSALADAVAPDAVYEAIVDHVAVALGASSCALWLREPQVLRLVQHVGYSAQAQAELAEIPIDSPRPMPLLESYRRVEPIWIASQRALLDTYPQLRGSATHGRAYRVSCLPLVTAGMALGVLVLTFDDERESTESERSFLLLVARYATQALERLRMLDAERRNRQRVDAVARRMTILSQASRAFGEAHVEHEQRVQNIVREIGTLMDAATMIALERDDGRLHVLGIHHPDPEAEAQGRSLAARVPWSTDDAAAAFRAYFGPSPIHAAMTAPLRVRGRTFGAIGAARVRPGQTFDADDLELLEGLADRAAAAIENSRLRLEADEARRRAEQLYHFASAAVGAVTLDQVLDAALAAILEALRVTRASILLFDDEGVMRFQAWRGLSDHYRAGVEGHSPWAPDAESPQPILVGDCLADAAWARYHALFREEGIGALAFMPLVNRGRLLGKFMVYYGEPHAFGTSDVEVSRTIANHLASMIARFRAVAELERTVRENELFAGVLAHDLRNPLGAIATAAQLALIADGRASKPLGRILASADRMATMIAQLLDFTRARVGGGIEVRRCRTSLVELARQAVGELELTHSDRTFAVTHQGDPHGEWDPDRLLQVISNLVGNACQHGDPQCVVTITIDGRATDAVTITVHNDGVIPSALVPHLFDPFRGRERRRGDSRGLGLGLYIVREIVRAHHGHVDVRSTEAEGTSFAVRLPRDV